MKNPRLATIGAWRMEERAAIPKVAITVMLGRAFC
jgi:hypothetical protein